ncbi:MAG TPA: penicillin-binding transpeptidase domain-containing protein, partial [Acidimicrobiales bacterium]
MVPSCSALRGDDGTAVEDTAAAYLNAWAAGDAASMAAVVVDPPADFAAVQQQFRATLQVVSAGVADIEVESSGGGEATASFTADLGLQGLGHWTYDGSIDLQRVDGTWLVAFTPASLHPALTDGARLQRVREQGPRAVITAANGQPLAVGGPGAGSRLDGLAGSLMGGLRELTASEAAQFGLDYAAGDLVGDDGVEAGYEHRLEGDPVGRIEVVDAAGRVTDVLEEFGGEAPGPLVLTLDYATQRAAEAAIANVTRPAALVAVDSRTGAIRAVANNPPGFDRALLGDYAPGSTFKIVTAAAVLSAGLEPNQIVPCPYEIRPGDSAPFTNAFGEDYGDIPLIEAFAKSCNTTFVSQGFQLGVNRLREMAETFGFNQAYDIGVPVVAPSFPLPESDTELGAASIGQGRVSVTPLHMATVAAAAYDGTWRPPYLAGEPPTEGSHALPAAAAAALPDFLREVVRSGTGTGAAIIGRDVGGKTGTAEFGDEDPPETHAWFAGFIDDLAFAVVVEGGGIGGEVAAPLVHEFLV